MSSYGSLSPATPPYYCAPPLQECNDFWTGELQRADVYSNQHTHYNHRGYDHQTGFLLDRCYGPPYGEGGLERDGGQPPAPPDAPPFPRVVKRRSTANKKERRRTQSINTAFSDLRDCIPNVPADTKLSKNINTAFSELRERIPNVPADTKLSKIKTLRLATSYIAYLLGVLETDAAPAGGFRAELPNAPARRRSDAQGGNQVEQRRARGRTGWPQHVWALELKQEQNI